MKYFKKIASLVLALTMALVLAVPAMAANTYTITAPNNGHTYEVYQIFTGDLYNGVLSNVKWGQNGTGTTGTAVSDTVLEELEKATGTDTEKLAVITKYVNLSSTHYNTVVGGTPLTGVPAGYYLIKDVDGALAGENDSYTTYIVEVVDDVTIAPKSDVPEVEKKVKDTNDSTGETSGWQDSADYDIGDSVPFQLKATLADNVSSYTTYKIVFHDTLSAGLTYNDDAKVTFNGNDVTSYFTIAETNGALTITCDNVKAFSATNSSVITVEYTATLNENAVIGSAGNPNEVYLEYSNNPNKSEAGNNETGNTPEDKVIVFTYKTIVNKVDGQGNSLTGAEFTLEKYNEETNEWKAITVVKNDEGTTFTFSGLDDGKYRLTETKTPAGYNSIAPIEFTITAEHDVLSDNPALTSLSGNATTGEITFTANTTEGSLSTNVVNKAGSTLPETGGIGTTIFYVVGGILVIGAGVVLVTKKRMG